MAFRSQDPTSVRRLRTSRADERRLPRTPVPAGTKPPRQAPDSATGQIEHNERGLGAAEGARPARRDVDRGHAMDGNDGTRWRAIEDLLDEALDLPAARREAFVRNRAGADPQLAQRVLQLLAAEQAAGEFMETGPCAAAPEAHEPTVLSGQIGPWKIEALLGRGGMGEVYRASRADGQFEQRVALKLLHPHRNAQAQRLQSERQILANLNHPHIARLIDGGMTADQRPYMAMELIEGRDLKTHLSVTKPSLEARLELFRKLCDAVSYAHGNLIVHRDIKPENILIDEHGEPRLLDFGIAKLFMADEALEQNQTQALATPNFAAPEQFGGGAITTRTDVYGLGATLYFLLCGKPPLDLSGASLPQLLDRLQHAEPPPASTQTPDVKVHPDLDAICAKAMHKDPAQRYASVERLAADLDRHQCHQPILARPPSLSYRLGRFLLRHRLAATALSAIALSLSLGLAATAWQAQAAATQRDQARRDAARLSAMQAATLRLFKSAASEAGEASESARALFVRAAAHIETEFHTDPVTAGGLMHMLGQLLLETEDYAQARELLERARSRLNPDTQAQELASIQLDLAHIAYRDGDLDQARRLHAQAGAIWQRDPAQYRSEQIWGATLASQIARADGDPARAVTILREAVASARTHWGANHQETGIVMINLAAAHYYNNDLPAALASCAAAWSVWQANGQTRSPDALNLLANWGLFALRQGDLQEGEKRLAEALELRTELYGASAAQATLMKNLGLAHRLNGRRNAGMRLLEQAEWMAREYAGAGGRLHASAAYALARALIEDGASQEAGVLLADALAAGTNKSHKWQPLNQILAASLDLDSPAQAVEARLTAGLASLRAQGKSALSEYADGLALYAEWLQHPQRLPAALRAIEEALERKRQARHPAHFEVLLMQATKADLLARSGARSAARELWQRSLNLADRTVGPGHPIHQRIRALQL